MANRFLFPRTILIHRPHAPSNPAAWLGKQPYQGARADTETEIARDVPASIQYAGAGKGSGAGLNTDAKSLADWRILTPKGALPKGHVSERDIVIDDEGKRYQVLGAYWTPMGWNMRCTLLQA